MQVFLHWSSFQLSFGQLLISHVCFTYYRIESRPTGVADWQPDAVEFARSRQQSRPIPLMSIRWTAPPIAVRPTSVSPGFAIRCDPPLPPFQHPTLPYSPPIWNIYHGNPAQFLTDIRSCFVDLMEATAEVSSCEAIATSYNKFPKLPPEMRNTMLSAALEARKNIEEKLRREQAQAIEELEDFIRGPPPAPATTVSDDASADLIELN